MQRNTSRIESLEARLLFHNPTIQRVTADNVGEALIQFDLASSEIDPAGFNKQSVRMLTAGDDGVLGSDDDARVPASVRFDDAIARLLVRASPQLTAGTPYMVRVVSSRVPVAPGFKIDGEFNGTFPSGDGTAGGNFEFRVKNDTSSTPLLRMNTTDGVILLRMRRDVAPVTVQNFFTYTDNGDYNNAFFTRSVSNFVIQGGSLQVDGNNEVVEGLVRGPIVNEFNLSNLRGTIAMAKQGGDPNSATNQFFFNLGDNSANLDNQNGGFTVFAEVATTEGLAVMDAIAAKDIADLTTQIGPFAATGVDTVPVQDQAQAEAGLDPTRDLIRFRTRRLMRILAV